MRILVTGGAGYVGSHAVRKLLQAGHDVCVYDNLSRGHRAALPAGLLVEGELADTPRLQGLLRERRIEAVMHFAALALVGESVERPDLYYTNNVTGSVSLLEAMRRADVKRIVFSSTTATYGVPQKVPITEDEPQRPINPYGFSKYVVERCLLDYRAAFGIGFAALRYFNAAGASPQADIGEDHDPESHLIPIVLQVALGQRQQLTIFGDDYPTADGTCVRDYVHVDDLADAHLSALQRIEPGTDFRINLGTGRGHSVREVLEACRRVTGHEIPAMIGQRRPGDPPELVADASRARQTLDWTPQYQDIEAIVETAWRWHQSHPNGYA